MSRSSAKLISNVNDFKPFNGALAVAHSNNGAFQDFIVYVDKEDQPQLVLKDDIPIKRLDDLNIWVPMAQLLPKKAKVEDYHFYLEDLGKFTLRPLGRQDLQMLNDQLQAGYVFHSNVYPADQLHKLKTFVSQHYSN